MASYLQGSYRAPVAFTVRVTHIDDASTSDFAVTAGTVYDSVDDALTAWNAQLTSDLGANKVTFALSGASANVYSDSISVTTGGASDFSVAWSQSGVGDSFRDWLGETADLASQADGYEFDGPHLAGYYLKYGLRSVRRTGTQRPRGQFLAQDGTSQTQHTADVDEVDVASVVIEMLIHGSSTGSYSGFSQLELFIDELFTMTGAMGGRFSVWHGEDGAEEQWICRLDDEQLSLMPRPVEEGGGGNGALFEVELPAIGVTLPW